MFRINFLHIIRDHINTWKIDTRPGIYCGDIITFLIFPILFSIPLVIFDVRIDNQIGDLIKALAIFGAFLFNLLAIIFNSIDKIKKSAENLTDNTKKNKKLKFAREIHINISFNIILSIFLIFFLLMYDMISWLGSDIKIIFKKFLLGWNYFLLFLFGLTLLMVLNRVYILVRSDSDT